MNWRCEAEFNLQVAENVWGMHPSGWPRPPRQRPRFWRWGEVKRLRDLESVFGSISNEALDRYYDEVRKGQSVYEDAGGYMLRCYRAMLGLEVDAPVSQADVIEDFLLKVGERR